MDLPKRSEVKNRYRAEVSESPMEWELNFQLLKRGVRGEKQYPIGPFFADIAFPKAMVAVEYDGEIHDNKKEQDLGRDSYFEKNGWRVVRVNRFNFREGLGNIVDLILERDNDFLSVYSSERQSSEFVPIKELLKDAYQKLERKVKE